MNVDHPVAECPDAAHHVSSLRRARRLRIRLEQQRSLHRSEGFGLVEEFGSIRELLGELGYLEGWALTPRGERLRKIYNESDLLVAETVEHGLFYGLEFAELAALASTFVYEPRTDHSSPPDWPTASLAERWEELERLWSELHRMETRYRLSPTRRPDPGFGRAAFDWASGSSFDDLGTGGLAPGDFVRVSRQMVDLLRQLRDGVGELRGEAQAALAAVDRGVVAAQGVG
jgi:ATP-dependent RNA helicase HelY